MFVHIKVKVEDAGRFAAQLYAGGIVFTAEQVDAYWFEFVLKGY